MWMIICNILNDTIFNGVIGVLSLIIGIISLIITIITMNTAGKIEKKINKMKSDAIVKSKFNESKSQLIMSFKQERDAVSEANVVTNGAWNQLFCRIGEIQNYKTLFDEGDRKKIEEYETRIKSIINRFSARVQQDKVSDFIEISNALINILEKGEYSL